MPKLSQSPLLDDNGDKWAISTSSPDFVVRDSIGEVYAQAIAQVFVVQFKINASVAFNDHVLHR